MKRVLVAIFVTFLTVGNVGCATVVPALPTVIAAVTDAVMILDGIQNFVDKYFAAKPNPALEEKVGDAMQKTRAALNVALRSAQGAQDLDQAKVDDAFKNFRAAYQELMVILGPLGVASAGNTLMAVPGGLQVPEPMALTLKVEE